MFLHIGENTDIFIKDIIMLINLPPSGGADFPNAVGLSDAPKTLVVTSHEGAAKYYLSGIRVSTLKKRIKTVSK